MPYTPPRIQILKSKLLVVEGKDEENFFSAALGQHLLIGDIQILAIGGKQHLHANLKTAMNDTAFRALTSLAIVCDADSTAGRATDISANAAQATFITVNGILASLGLPQPPGHGLFTPGSLSVGVFVMPDGAADGMLETLCLHRLPDNPASFASATSSTASQVRESQRRGTCTKPALMHGWRRGSNRINALVRRRKRVTGSGTPRLLIRSGISSGRCSNPTGGQCGHDPDILANWRHTEHLGVCADD